MLTKFYRNITAQIQLLVGFCLVGLVGLYIGHSLLEERHVYLFQLLENEQTKTEISHLLQKKLLFIKSELHEISITNSVSEMELIIKNLSQLQAEIDSLLSVLDKGGRARESYPVNFGNEEIIAQELSYKKYQHGKIDLEVIELRAKLVELTEMIAGFHAVVTGKLYANKVRNPDEIAAAIRTVNNYYKGMAPFFNRVLENSNRLHYESQQEVKRISEIMNHFSKRYARLELASVMASSVFVLLIGFLVYRNSKKILLERQGYQEQLQKTNENLESMVKLRTAELENEIVVRTEAEAHIQEQTDFLLTTIESLGHPFCVIDVEDYTVKIANSAAAAEMAYDKAPVSCYALTHHRDTPCAGDDHPCPLQMVKETGKPVSVEHIHYDSQENEIYVEVQGHPIFDKEGQLVQMIEYALDITDRKKAEHELRQINEQLESKVKDRTHELEEQVKQREMAQRALSKSERHFRRLIDNVSDIITIVDEQGLITYTSPAAEKILGVSPEYLHGRDIRELVYSTDLTHEDIDTFFERNSGQGSVEYRVADISGQLHVLESLIQKLDEKEGQGKYLLTSRDITARKKAEEEIRKLSMVAEQNPSSVVITDTEGKIEYVNPAFEKITGYSFAEVVGQNPRVLQSGQTPKEVFTELWACIKAGEIWEGEFINQKKNSEIYSENVLIIPIKNLKNEITHYVALKENITELKRARQQAEDANRAKSEFLSRMSHELRTPLNAVNGFSQLMLNSSKNPLNEKQRRMTEQINTAGKHLLQLINEVLDLARIESGHMSLSLEAVDPETVLDECLSLVQPLAKEQGVTINWLNPVEKLSLVRADNVRLKQVLLNMLSNAVKYNKPGGQIFIRVKQESAQSLRFTVRDTGIGIPLEKQAEIFVPFARAIEDTEKIEGSGIGMTITKQLVEMMNGSIGFESALGEGSSFWFTLPTIEPDAIPAPVPVPIPLNHRVNKPESAEKPDSLILYIEDNPFNIEYMVDLFAEQPGLQLTTRLDPEEGIQVAIKERPQLILLDMNLPKMDGFQVFRLLKANPETEFIPVVAVTADATDKSIQKALQYGFDGYLTKPLDVDVLRDKVSEFLEGEI